MFLGLIIAFNRKLTLLISTVEADSTSILGLHLARMRIDE